MSIEKTKLDVILNKLEEIKFAPEGTTEYWNDVEVRCDNSTDYVCDMDVFVKDLIAYIKS